MNNTFKNTPSTRLIRTLIEVGSIVFLFYSNLLMGEFTRKNADGKSFITAITDIFTGINFLIAIVTGMIGHFVFRFLRKKFSN